ncbi:MAG: hypothetical protein EOP04_09875, partial [Proteobacteria bacterium]
MRSINTLRFALMVSCLFMTSLAGAKPGVCDYDCNAKSKIRYACGVNIKWGHVSTKMCEDTNWLLRENCDVAKKAACAIGSSLEESGPEGPKQHHEQRPLKDWNSLFGENSKLKNYITQGISYLNFQKLTPQILTRVGYNADAIEQTTNGWREFWATSGLVCPADKIDKVINNAPFYYWKQVSVTEFCRKSWQHQSNNWENGFQRNRSRLECELKWNTQKFIRTPLTFACESRQEIFESEKSGIVNSLVSEYSNYLVAASEAVKNWTNGVNWNGTEEALVAKQTVSTAEVSVEAETASQKLLKEAVSLLDRKIAEARAYDAEILRQREEIEGFFVYFSELFQSKLQQVDAASKKFSETLPGVQSMIERRAVATANISGFIRRVESQYSVLDGDDYFTLPSVVADFARLRSSDYSAICNAISLKDGIQQLQATQAFQIDLVESLIYTLEAKKITHEFVEPKNRLLQKLKDMDDKIASNNYIFDSKYASLQVPSNLCGKFNEVQKVVDSINKAQQIDSAKEGLESVRDSFNQRYQDLVLEQEIESERSRIRDKLYLISKDVENSFSSGHINQLEKSLARMPGQLSSLKEEVATKIGDDGSEDVLKLIDEKIIYLKGREKQFKDALQLKAMLQKRLLRLVDE